MRNGLTSLQRRPPIESKAMCVNKYVLYKHVCNGACGKDRQISVHIRCPNRGDGVEEITN